MEPPSGASKDRSSASAAVLACEAITSSKYPSVSILRKSVHGTS
jgi:hypothetical protein